MVCAWDHRYPSFGAMIIRRQRLRSLRRLSSLVDLVVLYHRVIVSCSSPMYWQLGQRMKRSPPIPRSYRQCVGWSWKQVASLWLGDCAGITWPGITEEALDVSGIRDAASECGSEVISFETAGFSEITVPNAVHFHRLYLSNVPLKEDVVISLPKLKTHELTLYTGAVKNMFGVIPLKTRKQAHLLADRERFGDAVVDICSARMPHLAIMDRVVGMEGNGPSHGTPREVGLVMASYDCISLDVVASRLIG